MGPSNRRLCRQILLGWAVIVVVGGCKCSPGSQHYQNAINHSATADFAPALKEINLAIDKDPDNKTYIKLKKELQLFIQQGKK